MVNLMTDVVNLFAKLQYSFLLKAYSTFNNVKKFFVVLYWLSDLLQST